MKRKIYISFAAIILSIPALSNAADSNFKRDRNAPVAGRIPQGYIPLGLKLGAFTLAPGLDVIAENNDNIYYDNTNKTGDEIASFAPFAKISSDWSRNLLQASLMANYRDYEKKTNENTFTWDANIGGRLDVHDNSNLYANADFSQNYEGRNVPSSPRAAARPVKYDSDSFKSGFVAEFNRLRVGGYASYLKLNYHDVLSQNGGIIDQSGRDYNKVNFATRADYAISPSTSIYATGTTNTRTYTSSSVDRDSHGYDVGVGASFDLTNLVTGEVQVGYIEQKYKNPLYKKASGGSVAADVTYYATQLTSVTLHTQKSVEETPAIGASGYLSTETSLRIDHELLRNSILTASYSKAGDKYNGVDRDDKRTAINLGGQYLVSRNIALSLGYTYSENKSLGTAAIPSFKDNSVRVGLGLRY